MVEVGMEGLSLFLQSKKTAKPYAWDERSFGAIQIEPLRGSESFIYKMP